MLREEAAGSVKELCGRHGMSAATYCRWKSKYGGLEASDVKRLRELQHANRRLKQRYADPSLENSALKDLMHGKL